MELHLGRAPDMEFDLESGPGIKGDEPIPEEDDAVDTVTCCANVSLVALFCILLGVAVLAYANLPFRPALALTAVAVTICLVLMLAITAARDRYIGKRMADNLGAQN
ncbi:hypothetical protein PAHAL_5G146600 [Panicum hallii]|uniref:Uncharacterized protein n=1 Tax=Panicum hallii TaxID=206008 RepID=A0A2S3HRD6_9POAL|nr:hypothetical protein PAHAL_5G146600 [Panicum hallii]